MILAVVGTRSFTSPRGMEYAEWLLLCELGKHPYDKVVTGDPQYSNDHGVDAMTVRFCRDRGVPCETFAPKHRRWEPDGFKARNMTIVDACDRLLCIRCPGSSTYGSGWTANYAEREGKLLARVEIS